MKRNWFKRAARTFIQAAVPAAIAVVYQGAQSGEFGTAIWTGAFIAGAAAGMSAVQNAWENRRREGPVED